MPITTTPSERIGLCTRMRRFLVRFIRPESFVHTRSSAGFTITTSGFKFSVHTGGPLAVRTRTAAKRAFSRPLVPFRQLTFCHLAFCADRLKIGLRDIFDVLG